MAWRVGPEILPLFGLTALACLAAQGPPPTPVAAAPTLAPAVVVPVPNPAPELSPHPLVAEIPAPDRLSVGGIARFVMAHTQSDRERVEVVHDLLATTIEYAGEAGAQAPEPEKVLRARSAVCAGFAQTFADILGAMGLRATVIQGYAKDYQGVVSAHSWNRVQLEGRDVLVDVTWDAPGGQVPRGHFRRTYLFMPPEQLIFDHLPKDISQALLPGVPSLEEFRRAPYLAVGFRAMGWEIESQAWGDGGDELSLLLRNPSAEHLLVKQVFGLEQESRPCAVEDNGRPRVRARCKLTSGKPSRIEIYHAPQEIGHYDFGAALEVPPEPPREAGPRTR